MPPQETRCETSYQKVLEFALTMVRYGVFFLPLTSQARSECSDENEIWHEYNLGNSTFNGSSLTSLTDIVTSTIDADI